MESVGILSTGNPIGFYSYNSKLPFNSFFNRPNTIMGYFGSIYYETDPAKRTTLNQFVSRRLSTDPAELAKASEIVRTYKGPDGGGSSFNATELLIATWHNFVYMAGFTREVS